LDSNPGENDFNGFIRFRRATTTPLRRGVNESELLPANNSGARA
jgi:hypothetical protein